VARSLDGEHWQKLRGNPILELGKYGAFDEMGLGEPAVWIAHGYYWMLYTGRDAQQARRVLDRLVGYKVSPLLWKKVKRGLSAGRVQTAALRIVAEREREILAFEAVEYWTVDAELAKQTKTAERYVREWCAAQAAAEYLTYDPATGQGSVETELVADHDHRGGEHAADVAEGLLYEGLHLGLGRLRTRGAR
jgi:hypothetical protein